MVCDEPVGAMRSSQVWIFSSVPQQPPRRAQINLPSQSSRQKARQGKSSMPSSVVRGFSKRDTTIFLLEAFSSLYALIPFKSTDRISRFDLHSIAKSILPTIKSTSKPELVRQ